VHIERGELDQALAVARIGLPLRQQVRYAWGALDSLALRAALCGRLDDAGRIAGCADGVYAQRGAVRGPNEARARARLQGVLMEALGESRWLQLLSEGARLDEDEACRLALLS
jgi:hypothetical protein